MKLGNLPLAGKLSLGFGAVLTIVAIGSTVAIMELHQVEDIERVNTVSSNAQDAIHQARGNLESARASVRKFAITGADSDKASARQGLVEFATHMDQADAILQKDGPQFVQDLALYRAKVEAYAKNAVDPELELGADPATRPQAVALIASAASAPYSAAVDAAFASLEGKINPWSDSWNDAGYAAMNAIKRVLVGSATISILLGIAMTWLIIRAIGRPLTAITSAMEGLASGDHAVGIVGLGQTDEIGKMARAVQVFKDAAIDKLRLERANAAARLAADEDRARNEEDRARAARQQTQVVDALATGLQHLADGNLTFRLATSFADDYETLRGDFNAAVTKLQETMRVVAGSTSTIRSGTNEISAASDDLSRRTEQQAASLEETAAALDEITATVKKTSEGSGHARDAVSMAKTDAEASGEIVRQAVSAMNAIEVSSQKVTQIIGVIDEIAFQTNLLALNAGVEAARAGEAGRGFAVVASEVRGLAQRSAEAAKEIKGLISDSARQVNEGVHLVGETGKALGRIVGRVTEIDVIVTDIATSTCEQATALQQVNTAVNQMDQVTQQNAAMVEQSTAASKNLAQETEELAQLIGQFSVGEAGGQAASGSRLERRVLRSQKPRVPQVAITGSRPSKVANGGLVVADDHGWQEF